MSRKRRVFPKFCAGCILGLCRKNQNALREARWKWCPKLAPHCGEKWRICWSKATNFWLLCFLWSVTYYGSQSVSQSVSQSGSDHLSICGWILLRLSLWKLPPHNSLMYSDDNNYVRRHSEIEPYFVGGPLNFSIDIIPSEYRARMKHPLDLRWKWNRTGAQYEETCKVVLLWSAHAFSIQCVVIPQPVPSLPRTLGCSMPEHVQRFSTPPFCERFFLRESPRSKNSVWISQPRVDVSTLCRLAAKTNLRAFPRTVADGSISLSRFGWLRN